jgi:hypothetical protein
MKFVDNVQRLDICPSNCDITLFPCIQNHFAQIFLLSNQMKNLSKKDILSSLHSFASIYNEANGSRIEELKYILEKANKYEELCIALLHIYTHESFFFRYLNEILLENNENKPKILSPIIFIMIQSGHLLNI